MQSVRLKAVIFPRKDANSREKRLHQVYLAVVLALFAAANGFLALRLAAFSCETLDCEALYASYFDHPALVLLNLLPAFVFMALGYFLTRRAWAAYLISALPTIGFALVNYYKIQLRGDPFLASDIRLAATARGIVGHYSLDFTDVVRTSVLCAAAMLLFAVVFLRGGFRSVKARVGGTLVCLALIPLLYFFVFMNGDIYYGNFNQTAVRNKWSQVENFASRGFWYPFVRSVSKALPQAPEGYSAQDAQLLLAHYADDDIPPEKKVNVVGVMLEAFSDLSDFLVLAEQPGAAAVYTPLHALEGQSVSGSLLTNIFAAGTVDTEWGFLTGYSTHNEFRANVDSYVRYFKSQGYDTVYRHPGYSWFYNRSNINEYLGFDESAFTEDGFGELVDPEAAPFHSDAVLFDWLLRDLDDRTSQDPPLFSFAVSYQNHGPYSDAAVDGALTQARSRWSSESVGILNHYLAGVGETIQELCRFTQELEQRDAPVVLVVFGDHKPWLGNNSSVYEELGVSFDLSTRSGFYNYYSTPYLIWANSAAKKALNADFTGDGGDFSPCFLMQELFDQCSWEGPAFLGLQRDMRLRTPLLHERELYLVDGELTDTLPPDAEAFYRQYRCAEYWREMQQIK